MMRCPATPAEFERLMEQLESVPSDRRGAINRLVFEQVGACPRCEEPVRRCDGRRLVDDRLFHLGCISDAGSGAASRREGGRQEVSDG
jgi:hypothetical protein